jgi:hypothetical protein
MSKFEDHLWREVVRQHGHDLEPATPPRVKRRRARPRLLAGTTLGLAAMGAALALVLGAASSSPAFAVTPNHDGTWTVKILRSDGIAAANARLTALGVRARVVRVEDGCAAASMLTPQSTAVKPGAINWTIDWTRIQARIDPGKIPAGRTLVIAAWRAGGRVVVAPGRAVSGAPPVCLPPIPPTCPSPVAGNSGNSGNSGSAPSHTVTSGNSGNSGGGLRPVGSGRALTPARFKWCQVLQSGPPPSGNSGNSGNS